MHLPPRRQPLRTAIASIFLLLSMLALGGFGSMASAQDAAPGAASITLPFAASPDLCVAAPRPLEDYQAMLGTPSAGELPPTIVTAGEAADQETVDAVIATLVEVAACQSAGNYRALDSLYTDAGFREESGGGIDQASIDFIFASPQAADEADWQVLYDVSAVQRLEDGRVAAIVQFGPMGIYGVDLMIFAEQDGKWLIDQWVDEPFDIVPDFG